MSSAAPLRIYGELAAPRPLTTRPRPQAPARSSNRAPASWSTLGVGLTVTAAFYVIYAVPDAPLFMVCSFVLALACVTFVVLHRPGQTLTPAKVASLLYAASFCYAPLWLYERGIFHIPYFGMDVRPLMGLTSFITLVGYAMFLTGYFLVMRVTRRWGAPASQALPDDGEGQRRLALLWAVAVAIAGSVCYAKLIIGSGGIAYLLNYSGGRADITAGVYGGWFWGAHLLFAAYGLFAVAAMRRHPWLCLLAALALAAAFVPLQGRDIVVGPVFCWLVFFHVLRRPLKWRTVLVGALTIVLLAALLAAFRSGGNRIATHDLGGFFSTFYRDVDRHLTDVVSANIEQLNTAMIGVRYVELNGTTIGPRALTSWLAPLDRQFFGGEIHSIYTGVFMDLLVNPQHRGWNTALSPSLPGELYIALGWLGILLGMLVYGTTFGLLTRWGDWRAARPLLFAAYPFVVYMFAKMIVDGTTHAFRPMIVFVVALGCALLAPAGVRRLRGRRR